MPPGIGLATRGTAAKREDVTSEGTIRVGLELRVDGQPFARFGEAELAEAVAGADACAARSPALVIEVVRCRRDGTEVVVLHYDPVGPEAAPPAGAS
jgi:hypothetical protein